MLYKNQLKEFNNWLSECKICNEDKVKFDNWIKNSPQLIVIPKIPPLCNSLRDHNSIFWDLYIVNINVFFDKDDWINNLNETKGIPDIKSFHNWVEKCPMEYSIDKSKKTICYPHLPTVINVPGKCLVGISLEISILKDNWSNFQNKKNQQGEKITNEMFEKFILKEKTRFKNAYVN